MTIVDYDPTWPLVFETLRARYLEVLVACTPRTIEHVGSTSVPGLAAKPIIDIDIVVDDRDGVDTAIEAMTRVGFSPLGERGITRRWALRAPANLPATHTYVVIDGDLPLRNHLTVRDELRRDPRLRDAYGAHKRELAARFAVGERYGEEKTEFILRVLDRAGIDPADRATIARQNGR